MKNIAILGSTGSIGTQTLDVVRKNNDLRVVAVSAGRSVEKLEEQIREFHPLLAAVWDEKAAEDLNRRYNNKDCQRDGRSSGACIHAGVRYPCYGYCWNDWNPSDHGRNPCRKRYRTCQ